MDTGMLLRNPLYDEAEAAQELAACNAKTAQYGLALTEEQMGALAVSRRAALQATGRVEFGRGILRELVFAFGDSPYLDQRSYEETLAGLQELFYRFKEATEEDVPDDDLIDAMRQAFDEKAYGSLAALEETSPEELRRAVQALRQDDNACWSENDAYESDGANDEADDDEGSFELKRLRNERACERPGEEYAAVFYDDAYEMHSATGDLSGRIGGSKLR